MSIRFKIMLIFLVVVLSTHFVFTTIYYYYSQKRTNEEAVNHLEAIANMQEVRLNTFINSNFEKLNLINSRTQLRRSMERYNHTNDSEALKLINKILNDALKDAGSIEDIFIIGLNGEIVVSARDKHPRQSYKNHPLFKKGIKQPFTHYFLDEKDMESTRILFSAPLILQDEALGVIVMQVEMDDLNEYLQDYTGLGMSGEVLMALPYNENEMLYFTPLRFQKAPIVVSKNSDNTQKKPMRLALQEVETILYDAVDYRNVPVIAATRYLDILNFGIVVKMDKSEVLKVSYELKILISQLIIGVILIVVITSLLLANMITKPVINITEVATMISQGNYEKRIKALSKDELGKLTNAINEMAERLIGANLILEEKVKERTKELRQTNEKLKILSQTDSLTGIANRGKFDQHLGKSLLRSQRYQIPFSLLILDIDYFKSVNDHYGHQTGDIYLKKIGALLKTIVNRVDDLPARIGGEEFALIVEDTDKTGAITIAENIRQSIINLQLENQHSSIMQYVTVSIGGTTVSPNSIIKVEDILTRADQALYKAKKKGRNRVETLPTSPA